MSVIETSVRGGPVVAQRLEGSVAPTGLERLSGPDGHDHMCGEYRLVFAGRPRILGASSSTAHEVASWLASRWPAQGPKCLADLGGSWALCVEETRSRRIWLATDRFGAFPLFYAQPGEHLIFATNLQPLLSVLPRQADENGLVQYLTFRHVAGEQQLVAGVRRVLPGHAVRIDLGGRAPSVQPEPYFRPALQKAQEVLLSDADAIRRIEQGMREELEEAWSFHLDTAGPGMGMLFSSGLDSAYVLGSMSDEQRAELQLVTFGFKDNPSLDIDAAREALTYFRTPIKWEPLLLAEGDTLSALDRVIRQTELPTDHPNFLARSSAYRNLADRGAHTIIAGEGSDTLLGGVWYVSMQKMLYARQMMARYHVPRAPLALLGQLMPGRKSRLDLVREPDWQKVCVLAKAYVPVEWLEEALAPWGGLTTSHFHYQKSILDRHGSAHPIQGVYEQGLMANMSVELMGEHAMAADADAVQWNPYLDGRFPERVCPIPAELRTKGWKKKYLLYLAAEGKLPPNILHRPKCGCPAPLVRWFSAEKALGGALDLVIATNSFCGRYLDGGLLNRTVDRFRRSPNSGDAEVLWVLLNLERWAELVLHPSVAAKDLAVSGSAVR